MKNLYQKKVQKRTFILLFFLTIWFGGLILRLAQLQIIDYPQLRAKAIRQNQDKDLIYPERGTIYDRTGNILARSIPCQSVFLIPFEGEPYNLQLQKINKLKRILRLSPKEIQKIKSRIKKNDTFIWIKRKVNLNTAEKISNLSLEGVHLREESIRFYPQNSLAGHVIGRVNIDGVGQSGVEYKYDSILGGEPGERINLRDAKRREYRFEILKNPKPGKDIILTIDETIQYYTSRELKKAALKLGANWGVVIISHPSSGEILAMANFPEYDLNRPPSRVHLLDRNKAIHQVFDPGSTFKIITASAAIESHKVALQDTFDCSEGLRRIAGKTIRDHHKFEILRFPEIIIHSSNVGATLIGERLGAETLYDTIQSFGFGKKTGIDLPAEEKGIFWPLKKWTTISCASLSIGYEIAVTPIQMLQTINIIANRGMIIPPRIVKIIPQEPEITSQDSPPFTRAISEKTAAILCDILKEVVDRGTGQQAQIQGYNIAGKTGTAQKLDPSTGVYTSRAHLASFVGFVPTENPLLSMIVIIDEPQDKYYGGDVAAPIFRDIATLVLRYLQSKMEQGSLEPMITAKTWRNQK